jgi:hypothetical protein
LYECVCVCVYVCVCGEDGAGRRLLSLSLLLSLARALSLTPSHTLSPFLSLSLALSLARALSFCKFFNLLFFSHSRSPARPLGRSSLPPTLNHSSARSQTIVSSSIGSVLFILMSGLLLYKLLSEPKMRNIQYQVSAPGRDSATQPRPSQRTRYDSGRCGLESLSGALRRSSLYSIALSYYEQFSCPLQSSGKKSSIHFAFPRVCSHAQRDKDDDYSVYSCFFMETARNSDLSDGGERGERGECGECKELPEPMKHEPTARGE